MSEDVFEPTVEEVAHIRRLRASTEVLSTTEVNLLRKRRERGETGESELEVTLDSIKPGMDRGTMDAVLKRICRLAG